jgi:hypothetical protein
LHDDRRIRIRSRIRIHTSDKWIRILEAQKHVDPVDPDPQHCMITYFVLCESKVGPEDGMMTKGLDKKTNKTLSFRRVEEKPRGSENLRPVFRSRIHRIHMFLGLPDPDPLVRGMDPDPDPSIIMQNSKKNLDSYYFVTLFDFLSLKNDVNVPSKSIRQKKLC